MPYAGTSFLTTATFTNPGSDEPVDPSTVTLKFAVGDGEVTTWAYEGAGSIAKVDTGIYSATVPTVGDDEGQLAIEWIGTDACAAVGVVYIQLAAPPL